MLEKKRGRSHCKYVVEDLSLREWCKMEGYSYQVALKCIKSGMNKSEMEIRLKKKYMKSKSNISNAAKIYQARWKRASINHNRKELMDVRSEFEAEYGNHPRYEFYWDKIVDGGLIITDEEWKVLPWANNYECSDKGRVRKRLKDGCYRLLHPYIKSSYNSDNYYKCRKTLMVKIGKTEQTLARIVAILFVPRTADKNVVHLIDNKFKHVYKENIEWLTLSEHGHRTGYAPLRSRPVEQLDPDGNVIKTFRSARDAGKHLYLSYQTVLDYCNSKVKNPICILRFKED